MSTVIDFNHKNEEIREAAKQIDMARSRVRDLEADIIIAKHELDRYLSKYHIATYRKEVE
ncbi:MAG: hypothetical protein CMI74_04165 [Candidatus Pelagibacter sp.]|nr:hypothetical protein [Candidatus Pelagibacter sp.]|tara:strand:+ start:4683 stop:4862 length:180 start_codon:yes stop_codon:yes gene_type:complete